MKKLLISVLLAAVTALCLFPATGCGAARSSEQLIADLSSYRFLDKCIPQAVTALGNSWYSNYMSLTSASAYNKSGSGDTVQMNCKITCGNEHVQMTSEYLLEYDTTAADGSWQLFNVTETTPEERYVVLYLGNSSWQTVADEAFKGNTEIDEIVIVYGMTEIGQNAFEGCTSLKKVIYNSDSAIVDIYPAVFKDCTALEEVVMPTNLLYIYHNAFEGCTALKSVDLSQEYLSFIDAEAFAGCSSLKEIKINSTRKNAIANRAFADCTSLQSVTLSANTVMVGNEAFTGCSSLKKLTVPADNTVYKVNGNQLIEIATDTVVLSY